MSTEWSGVYNVLGVTQDKVQINGLDSSVSSPQSRELDVGLGPRTLGS